MQFKLLVECAVGYVGGYGGHGRSWKAMEGHGRPWKVMEGHRMSLKVFSYHQIDILSEKSYWWCVQSAMLVCAVGYVVVACRIIVTSPVQFRLWI